MDANTLNELELALLAALEPVRGQCGLRVLESLPGEWPDYLQRADLAHPGVGSVLASYGPVYKDNHQRVMEFDCEFALWTWDANRANATASVRGFGASKGLRAIHCAIFEALRGATLGPVKGMHGHTYPLTVGRASEQAIAEEIYRWVVPVTVRTTTLTN